MELTHENKKKQIVDRLENNYNCFQISLMGVSRSKLIEMASRIVAVTEMYEILTEQYDWDDEGELDFYLLFRDPLTIIADAWESRRSDMTADFDNALFDVAYSDKILSEYPLIDGVEANLYDSIMSFHND